jgi:tetratricopeptide (TPR) repeat protein
MRSKITFCLLVYFQLFFSFIPASFSQSNKSHYNLLGSISEHDYEQELDSCFNLFKFYYNNSYSDSALIFAQKGIELSKKSKNLTKLALFYNATGMFYYQKKSNYVLAFENLLLGFKVAEDLNYERGLEIISNNLGLIYMQTKNYEQSLYYFTKSLSINKKTKNDKSASVTLSNIEIVYSSQKDYEKALLYGEESIKIQRTLNDSSFIANVLNNVGDTYLNIGKSDKAFDYYKEALIIAKLKNQQDYIAKSFMGISKVYKKQDILDSALYYCSQAFEISKVINDLTLISNSHKNLSEIFYERKKYKDAYEHYVQFYTINDSIFNQEVISQISGITVQYETEKKQKEIELLNKENEKQAAISEEKNKKKNIIILSVVIGLCLVIVFSAFLFNRFNVTRKQKVIIEEKQKEITDSINFAKRIQTAILPPKNYWKKHLPESFIMYEPKDIVSGDFYWLENVNDLILFAAADCTGHGVSGAMVSVVCSNALNRTVKEFDITNPSKILDKTRELVLETFAKSESDIKDGMDISLCALNTKTNQLQWSGANNPLWHISGNSLNEIKGDKQPIGKTDYLKPFSTHSIQLQKGDTIYIFTDGYADQFGGEKNKKFMYKPLKNLLTEIHQEPLEIQKEVLEQKFASWKGDTEQTDDVLIIGLRI